MHVKYGSGGLGLLPEWRKSCCDEVHYFVSRYLELKVLKAFK